MFVSFFRSPHAAINILFTSKENLNNDQSYNYQYLRISQRCFGFGKEYDGSLKNILIVTKIWIV